MSEHLNGFTGAAWPVAGFLIFISLFIAFVVVTFLPSQKKLYGELRRLPLNDGDQEVPK